MSCRCLFGAHVPSYTKKTLPTSRAGPTVFTGLLWAYVAAFMWSVSQATSMDFSRGRSLSMSEEVHHLVAYHTAANALDETLKTPWQDSDLRIVMLRAELKSKLLVTYFLTWLYRRGRLTTCSVFRLRRGFSSSRMPSCSASIYLETLRLIHIRCSSGTTPEAGFRSTGPRKCFSTH